jgi:hypothetical protein
MASPSEGAIELRVNARGRSHFVAALAVVAIGWTAAMLTAWIWRRPMPLAAPPSLAIAIAILLGSATFWCGCADEFWRLSRGLVEHRVGWKRLTHVRRIEDRSAALTIRIGYGNTFSTPYYRLYAIASGRECFLFQRGHADELRALAGFMAAYTGWTNQT